MNLNHFVFYFVCILNLLNYVPSSSASPIIGGVEDNHYTIKYHVSIHMKNSETNRYEYKCGGTLINIRYILTVAQCFILTDRDGIVIRPFDFSQKQPKIIAGTERRTGPGIDSPINKILIPGIYRTPDKYADIAVAQTVSEVQSRHYEVEIMRVNELDIHSLDVGNKAMFSGFGLHQFVQNRDGNFVSMGHFSDINRVLVVTMLGQNECSEYELKICARSARAGKQETACFGDSGAGLIWDNAIVGVLSVNTAQISFEPMKFTRISEFKNFINDAMDENSNHDHMHVYIKVPTPHSSPENPALSEGHGEGHGEGSSRPKSSKFNFFKPSRWCSKQ